MNNNRASYRVGLVKAFHLYDSRVKIEFGITFLKRNYVKNNIVTKSDYERKENVPYIEYKYVLTTKYDEEHKSGLPLYTKPPFNTEYSLAFKFKVIDNLYATLDFAYSRNYYVLYDVESTFRYYLNGSSTPNYIINSHGPFYSEGIFDSKRDHFFYSGIGLNYDFNFKQKEATKL